MGPPSKSILQAEQAAAGVRQLSILVFVAVVICLVCAVPPVGVGMAHPQSTEPASQAALERQINAALSQGRSSLAAESLDKLLNEPHLDSALLLRTGIAFAQSALFPEAVRAFTRCVRDYPTVFEGHYDLALAELASGHLAQAYAAIDQAPHQSEQESTARIYLRGKIEAGMGRLQLAQQDLSAAFAKDPGRENFALDLGLVYLQVHAYPQSERVFAQSSALNPHSNYLLLGLALTQFLEGRTSQSVESSKRLLASSPEFSPARLLLGFTLYFDGKFGEAREVASAGLKLPDPDPYLYYLEAATLLKQHGREQAQILDDLTVAEKRIPDCALCYVASGKVHEEHNELQAAVGDLEKAVRLAPDLSEGWYHLAAVYTRLGEAAEAVKAREHFQAMKANADEREKQIMQGVLLESLGAQSHAGAH
jgi:tetratricopeptide (TPR) repeat protein